MKTKLIATLILFCATISLTGCTGKAPKNLSEIAEKLARNTAKQESYIMDLDASLDMYMKEKNDFMDFDMDFEIGADMLIKENNGSSYQKGTIGFSMLELFGGEPKMEIEKYSIKNNSSSMIYELQDDGQWTAQLELLEEETVFDEENKESTIQEFTKLIEEYNFEYQKNDVKKIDGKKVWCYKASVPLNKLLESETASDVAGDYIAISPELTDTFECNVDIELYVYAKDVLPARLSLALPESIKSFDENGNGFSLEELFLYVEMTQWGTVEDIVVPEDVEAKCISYQTWLDQQPADDWGWIEDDSDIYIEEAETFDAEDNIEEN